MKSYSKKYVPAIKIKEKKEQTMELIVFCNTFKKKEKRKSQILNINMQVNIGDFSDVRKKINWNRVFSSFFSFFLKPNLWIKTWVQACSCTTKKKNSNIYGKAIINFIWFSTVPSIHSFNGALRSQWRNLHFYNMPHRNIFMPYIHL